MNKDDDMSGYDLQGFGFTLDLTIEYHNEDAQ